MNDKKFDSFIKQSLDGHSSTVPVDMWKRIQAEKDFDPFVKENLNNHNSPVPADMWQRIQNEKDFDAAIRQKLDDHNSPVPADMWQRIRPGEKKRRPVIWWWAAAASLLLMAGIGATWYFNHKSPSANISNNTHAPSANGVQADTGITALPNQASTANSPIRHADSLTAPGTKPPETQNNPGLADHANPVNPGGVANSSAPNPNNSSAPNNTRQAFSNRTQNGSNGFNSQKQASNNEKNLQGKNNNPFDRSNPAPNTSIAENGNEAAIERQSLLNSTNNAMSNSEKSMLLKQLIRSSLAKNKLMPKQLLRANAKAPSIVCPTLGPPNRNDWYVEAFLSPDLIVKKLQDKPNGQNIKSGMDSTLHRQVSFSAGVNIVKNLGENFLVKTGVQYSQVNELFRYNNGSNTRTTTVITTRDVVVTPGDTIHISDTSTVSQTGTLAKQTQNHYRQWDIPLIFGYEFGGKGMRLNANAGIIANIRSSYQGNMLDTAQKVIDIPTYNNTGIYKTNIGLGVYLGLGILKPLNDNMDLLIEPHARFNLSNMTTEAAIFNQKNTVLGLSLGIRYKINGHGQRY